MSKKLQHALVLTHYHRVEVLNPIATRYINQPTGQGYPYPVSLPAIFDNGRLLGLLVARVAIVAHDGDDLVLIIGI